MKSCLLLIVLFLNNACNNETYEAADSSKPLVAKAKTDSLIEASIENNLPAQEFSTDLSDKSILSLQDTLYLGDTLTIKFKVPHPKDLAILDPDGNFFFLVYAGSQDGLKPLIDYETFGTLDKLDIVPSETKANPWNASIHENRIVFAKAGSYEIRLSENLETDDGTPIESVRVYYTAKSR